MGTILGVYIYGDYIGTIIGIRSTHSPGSTSKEPEEVWGA